VSCGGQDDANLLGVTNTRRNRGVGAFLIQASMAKKETVTDWGEGGRNSGCD